MSEGNASPSSTMASDSHSTTEGTGPRFSHESALEREMLVPLSAATPGCQTGAAREG